MKGIPQFHLKRGLLVASSVITMASAANAQEAASPAEDPTLDANGDASLNDQEIVVTARKFDERIQDVPVSITAFSGNTLCDRGAVDLKDILRSVPGLASRTSS